MSNETNTLRKGMVVTHHRFTDIRGIITHVYSDGEVDVLWDGAGSTEPYGPYAACELTVGA